MSGEFLTRVGCGDITAKGAIDRLDGDGVVFADGTRERIDAIVWATGYNVTFPFFEQQSKLVAAAIAGRYAYPSRTEMEEIIVADERTHLGHFYDSPRHRMKVDFNVYVRDLLAEISRGAERLTPVTSA